MYCRYVLGSQRTTSILVQHMCTWMAVWIRDMDRKPKDRMPGSATCAGGLLAVVLQCCSSAKKLVRLTATATGKGWDEQEDPEDLAGRGLRWHFSFRIGALPHRATICHLIFI